MGGFEGAEEFKDIQNSKVLRKQETCLYLRNWSGREYYITH
jgi:hypothetical protein